MVFTVTGVKRGYVPTFTSPKKYTLKRYRTVSQNIASAMNGPRMYKSISNRKANLTTCRTVTLTRISASGAGETNFQYSFQLSDLPNSSEFTSLYDEYRFDRVVMKFYPDTQDCTPASGTGNTLVYSALDYDDANVTNIASIQQYSNCMTHNSIKPFGRSVIPRHALAAYSGAFTSYAQSEGWVDCNSPSVQHYGIKIAFPLQAGNVNTWTPVAVYYLSFRGVR